jgi:DNA-3-methyladenine glycosylase I
VKLVQGDWTPPDWWYRKKCPPNDDVYFENMSRVIFQAGLNWNVIEKKWPTTRKAFAGFNIDIVSKFTDNDVERLLKDKGIVRNRGKIEAIMKNAVMFKEIKKQYGSFKSYLDSSDKSKNYSAVVKDLNSRFKWLGPSSASLFLYSVGENIEPFDRPH